MTPGLTLKLVVRQGVMPYLPLENEEGYSMEKTALIDHPAEL